MDIGNERGGVEKGGGVTINDRRDGSAGCTNPSAVNIYILRFVIIFTL